MSKRVSQLLAVALLAGASFVEAHSHGTFLTIVPGDADLRSLVAVKSNMGGEEMGDAKTSHFGITAGYSRTWDSNKLATYFMPDAVDAATVTLDASSPATTAVDAARLVRITASNVGSTTNVPDATVTISPVSTRFALGLSYCQDLKNVMEGAWFHLGVSLARVKNDLRAVVVAGAKHANDNISIDGLLQGDVPAATTINSASTAIAALNAGRIKTAYAPDAQTRPEEIRMRLGYDFVSNDSGKFGGFVSGVIGLGTEPTMEYLFEPVVGHRNFGVGAGLQGCVNLSSGEDYDMHLRLNGQAHYLFAREDYRLGRFVGLTGNYNWAQYWLAKDSVNTLYAPAANFLRQKVDVTPRYTVDLGAQFVYAGECTQFDLGYAMNYRAKEDNKLKTAWNDAMYDLVAATDAWTGGDLKAANLTWNEDSQLLHTIHGGVLYTMNDMENPVALGLGGSISLANDRTRSEQHWSVFGKLGVSF